MNEVNDRGWVANSDRWSSWNVLFPSRLQASQHFLERNVGRKEEETVPGQILAIKEVNRELVPGRPSGCLF